MFYRESHILQLLTIRPTFETVPILDGSNAPCFLQKSITAEYTDAYELSGITALVSLNSPFLSHFSGVSNHCWHRSINNYI